MKKIKDIIKQIRVFNLVLWLMFALTFISYPVELVVKVSMVVIVFIEITRVSSECSTKKTFQKFFFQNTIELSDEDKKHVSCHEAGHALICKMSDNMRLEGISINPEEGSAGHTLHSYIVIRCNRTREDYMDEIHMAFGGIMAEEIVFGHYRDGGFQDIKKAKRFAFDMLESGYGNKFVYGEAEMRQEIEKILQKAKKDVKEVLNANRNTLLALQQELLENEEMDEREIRSFFRKNHII